VHYFCGQRKEERERMRGRKKVVEYCNQWRKNGTLSFATSEIY